MVYVKAQPGDTSDSVIRKFTKKVIAEGLLLEFKKKEFYQKPAEVRKEAKKNKMTNILIKTDSHYKVNRKRVRRVIDSFLMEKKVKSAELSISVVGDRQMKKLNRQYRNLDETTDILSFPF